MSLTTRHLSERLGVTVYRPEPMISIERGWIFDAQFGEIEDDVPDCADPWPMQYRPAKRAERHSVIRQVGFGGGSSRPSSARRRRP